MANTKFRTTNPYDSPAEVMGPEDTIDNERRQARSKAVARFPHEPLQPFQDNHEQGRMKRRAFTPGGPAGS